MDTLKKLIRDWRFWTVAGLLIVASWLLGPSGEPAGDASPTPQASPSTLVSVAPTIRSTSATAPRIVSVIPSAGKIGTQVTITGTGFSRTGNTITLRAKNKNIQPWYILTGSNFLSSDEGTKIVMGVTPSVFTYGQCRATDAFCGNRVQKLEPGEYTLTVQAANCSPATCTSNGMQFILVQ